MSNPMKKIELKHGKENASLTVVPFGATIISWIVEGQEKIFVSKKAIMDGSKAIRGGVPVCFPNFGPWSNGPQHGFARNSPDWKVNIISIGIFCFLQNRNHNLYSTVAMSY